MTDIEFGQDQALLAKTASDVMRDHSTFQAVRTQIETEAGYDAGLLSQLAELGLLGVAVPEAHGGAGMGGGDLVPVAEAMGRYLYAGPWLAVTLAGHLLGALDDAAGHGLLPDLVAGKQLGTLALSEPDGAYDPLEMETRAVKEGDLHRLSGTKTGVLDALSAQWLLVSATCGGEPGVFLLRRDALADDALQREVLIDESRRSYRLVLDGTPAVRLAGDAAAALRSTFQLGALLLAADMAGGVQGCLDLTLDYLRTRTQFGKPIGGYQALKHPTVDIFVASEQGRSLLYHAATVFDGVSEASEIATRMAKTHCGATYTHGADRSIQFHGAIGFTYECHAQLFFRRAQWGESQFGDGRHHRRALAGLLLDSDADWSAAAMGAGAVA